MTDEELNEIEYRARRGSHCIHCYRDSVIHDLIAEIRKLKSAAPETVRIGSGVDVNVPYDEVVFDISGDDNDIKEKKLCM